LKNHLYDTVKKLNEANNGAALVINEKDQLVDIISERDILYKWKGNRGHQPEGRFNDLS